MQTGVVMVVYIDEAFHRRVREGRLRTRDDIVAAHAEGTVQRLRPKIMTITTMAASLLPLLWADGAGADIMRRVAAPMLGGLATSAFLTLEVLPGALHDLAAPAAAAGDRAGRPDRVDHRIGPGAGRPPDQRPRHACRQRHHRRPARGANRPAGAATAAGPRLRTATVSRRR